MSALKEIAAQQEAFEQEFHHMWAERKVKRAFCCFSYQKDVFPLLSEKKNFLERRVT